MKSKYLVVLIVLYCIIRAIIIIIPFYRRPDLFISVSIEVRICAELQPQL